MTVLEDIGTIWAEPVGVRCVRWGSEAGSAGFGVGGDEGGLEFVE